MHHSEVGPSPLHTFPHRTLHTCGLHFVPHSPPAWWRRGCVNYFNTQKMPICQKIDTGRNFSLLLFQIESSRVQLFGSFALIGCKKMSPSSYWSVWPTNGSPFFAFRVFSAWLLFNLETFGWIWPSRGIDETNIMNTSWCCYRTTKTLCSKITLFEDSAKIRLFKW